MTANSITTSDGNNSAITISGGIVSGGSQIGCDLATGLCKVIIKGEALVKDTTQISGFSVNIEENADLTTGIGSIFGRNSVVITGGTVTANGSNSVIYTTDNGAGIRGVIVSGGSITISEESGTTRVTAEPTVSADEAMRGIYAAGNIEILGGTVNATGNYYGIHSIGITISGNSIVNATGDSDGIVVGNVDICGGTVTAIGKGKNGILSAEFTISVGYVKANGSERGIYNSKNEVSIDPHDYSGILTIDGGEVEATGSQYGIESETVIINEGTVRATATAPGIDGGSPSTAIKGSSVSINGGEVTATGVLYALYGSVKNTIPGIGWLNPANTGNYVSIEKLSDQDTGQDLSQYKKVRFPAPYVKKDPAAKNLTYNGSPQALVTAGEASGGTMKYALGENDSTAPAGGWIESIPEKTDAQQQPYYVWYKVSGVIDNISIESDTVCVPVTIARKPIDDAVITLDPEQLTYTGSVQSVSVTEIDGLSVTAGSDYTISGNTGINAGQYTANIAGQGNYTGSTTADWSIGPKSITGAAVTLSDTSFDFTGSERSVTVTSVKLGDETLEEGKDYTVTGKLSGKDADTYTVEVTGKGNYTGTVTADWSIGPGSIKGAKVTLSGTSFAFTGSEQRVTVESVTLGSTTLTAGTDYDVKDGTTGTDKGSYTVTVEGKGNYTGTASAYWSIGLGTPVIEKIPTASAVTYGQTLADSALTDGKAAADGNTVAGVFAWKDPALTPAVSDSGTTKYAVVFTPEDTENFAIVECEVTVEVNKADKPLTYAGTQTVETAFSTSSQTAALSAAEGGAGDVTYAVESQPDGNYFSLSGTTLTIAAGTPAGSYTVIVRAAAAGNENYNSSYKDSTVTVEVKSGVSIPATVTGNQLTFNGSPQALVTVTGEPAGGTMQYALGTESGAPETGWSSSIPTGTGAGTYYVWYKAVGNESHSDSPAGGPVKVVIAQKGGELTDENKPHAYVLTYTGEPQELVTPPAKLPEGYTRVQYSLDGGVTWTDEVPTGTESGDYTVSVQYIGDADHVPVLRGDDIPVMIARAMEMQVDFILLKHTGAKGLPEEISSLTLEPVVHVKDGDAESVSKGLKLELTKEMPYKVSFENVEFTGKVTDPAPGKYEVTVSGLPKSVTGRDQIYSSEGPVEGPVKWKYELIAKGEINEKDGKIVVTVYLIWDNGSRPEEVRVVALPEDEIGAYKLRPDGTKEYLLFQTYDICMAWLGSDELCRGPERCYHK